MKQNKIYFASKNVGKISEIKSLLPNLDIELLPVDFEEIEETGTTFEENAKIKAKYVSEKLNVIAISDDSGLCVNSLNGEPGVYSKRYASSDNMDDNLLKVIENLKNKEDKTCTLKTCLCLYFPTGEHYFFEGKLDGEIIDHFRGENGFGYDKIFYIKELDKTLAELTREEKNSLSHRFIAMNKLIESGLLTC